MSGRRHRESCLMLWQSPTPLSGTRQPRVALLRSGAGWDTHSRCSHDLVPESEARVVQAVGISERGTTVFASASRQLCPPLHLVGCIAIMVFGGWDLGWRPISGRSQCGGGRLEVVDGPVSYAGRRRRHPLCRSGRIVCMVSELFDRVWSAFAYVQCVRSTHLVKRCNQSASSCSSSPDIAPRSLLFPSFNRKGLNVHTITPAAG